MKEELPLFKRAALKHVLEIMWVAECKKFLGPVPSGMRLEFGGAISSDMRLSF
jgi:hypothetical protein